MTGEDIRAARTEAGLTQTQLGELLNVDQARVSRLERGKGNVRSIDALAIQNVLGLSPKRPKASKKTAA